ncbi:tRNA1(Val) (adenine(37)-N6)-methyltransferase [Pedobacter fastidiosus]|uniref:tRNA1(Val) (adenine(37)-N6)-methyltransferase n=1 Tax=Pedobacter fastidiosus TaxID=2765361 RepID=A0ABR7KYW1_9SPHI|nr:methyltransferase [Pedobacter fastidiosus]MBC6112883.1 methyltransferase [Pedobacter fastidiosus]
MSIFKFKQFDVDQSGCAMKINTDGVLLAASVFHPKPKRILDIGAGTGVIALMLAQRFNNANIDAVEIDEQAAVTASNNFKNSPFSQRLSAFHISIEDYSCTDHYDLIVSNPPFFVNDLKNEEARKGIARHADHDFFEMLIRKSSDMLNDKGCFWLILPVKQADYVIGLAPKYGFFLRERISMHSDKDKPTFRQMVCLRKEEVDQIERDFYIYESLKQHTQEYKKLLKDFFLAL